MVETDPRDRRAQKGPRRNILAEAARVLDLGLRVVISVGLFGAAGFFLDKKLELRIPVATLVGAAFGFFVGFWLLVRGVNSTNSGRDPKDPPGSQP